MDNATIADTFTELHARLTLAGEKPFRILAYAKAADTFRELPVSVAVLHADGRLGELDGIGPAITEKVGGLLEHGTFDALDRARADVPDGLLELTCVSGVGTKTALKIWTTLEATTFGEVVAAAESGALADVPGVGPKLVAALLAHDPSAADAAAAGPLQVRRDQAQQQIVAALEAVEQDAAVTRLHVAGSYLRGCEVIADLDLVCEGDDATVAATAAVTALAALGWIDEGSTGVVIHAMRTPNGLDARIHGATADSLEEVLLLATGPAAYTDLRHRLAVRVLAEVPPELRDRAASAMEQDHDSAPASLVPRDLLQLADMRAELHCHSTWSDGDDSIIDMARAAMERGDTHMVITDHSAPYALVNGLDEARLLQQAEEVARVNDELAGAFTVLCGSEVEILADGSLGLADHVLERLDWVVASIHTAQKQDAESIRTRMERVLANPLVDCIGHPTSRILLRRPSTQLDTDWLIEHAAETGVVLELNASPHRLDLDERRVRQAADAGVRIAIDSDAHNTRGLGYRAHGVGVARRAALTRGDVVNCLDGTSLAGVRPRARQR